ncbi:MAG: FAD:protein FMN transferase [Candidatus Cloacimonetes bacterium]|nr:FAD:protein FMN transferase [Candidatus Cloacimonadota bacterium]
MKRKDYINLAVLLLVIAFACLRFHFRKYSDTQAKILLDTLVEISAESRDKSVSSIIDSTFSIISEYEKEFSYHLENSRLHQINNGNGTPQHIDEDFYTILALCEKYYTLSDSLFDISIAPLLNAWDFEKGIIPESETLNQAKSKVGFYKIQFNKNELLLPAEMELNLGAIAKGFIVDKAVDFMIQQGVECGYINAGGDIRFFGFPKTVSVGIQNPRDKNSVIAELDLPEMSVVTSGDYERFFEHEGVRYHHIINPKTGYPAEKIISVTVIAKTATLADILSTTIFLMNPDDGIQLIKSIPDTEAIIYYQENDELVSLKSLGIKKYLKKEYLD